MAGKENQRKRKLNMEASKIDRKLCRLPNGSKLLEFVSRGQISDVIDILKVIPTNSKSFNAAFLKATELGQKRILQKFIETGASVNAKNDMGNTSLHVACMHGFIDLVKLLVRNGSKVDCQNKDGQTALMLAVEKACSLPLLEYLTSDECCANINIQDCHGETALMVAIKLQDLCAMKLLMAHKDIKLDIKDESGKSAFDIAKDNGLKELFSTFKACFRKDISVSPLVTALKKNSISLVQSVLYTLSPEEVNTVDASSFSPLMFSLSLKSVNIDIVRKLLAAGAKVNIGSPNDNITPLFLACRDGNLEAVKLLVAEDADVNTQTKHKQLTTLMCSCEDNKLEIVKFLLKQKADISLTNSNGETALMVALRCKNKDCAEELIKCGAEINDAVFHLAVKAGWHQMLPNVNWVISQDVINEALVLACKQNNYELAKFLLEHGAEVNQTKKYVPLILALSNPELLSLLLRFGADVNLRNCSDSFPLAEAVRQDNIITLETLIKHGADLNAKDFRCYTALMTAAKLEKLNFMNILLDAGADINHMSDCGISALNVALSGEKIEAAKLLLIRGANVNQTVNYPLLQSLAEVPEHMELLLKHGADPNLQFPDGSTVLIKALETRCTHSKIKLLLSFGADPNTKNKNGESALIVAAKYCTSIVMELLIKSGADINARDKNGSPVLLCAVAHSIAIDNKIAFLLNCGVDVNQGNHDGDHPLIVATRCCNLNILQLLVNKGANVNAQDKNGMTSLMHAANAQAYEKVKFLIDCNANLNIQSNTGFTAAMMAVAAGRPLILKALIDAGANINIVNEVGNSVISLSISSLNIDPSPINLTERLACLKLVLLAGSEPDLRNQESALLFHKLIVSYDESELIDLLMRTGAPPPVVSADDLKSICCIPSYYYILCEKERAVTPLLTAMFAKKIKLALFFLKYWYLDKSDILFLHKNILHNQIYIRHLSNNSFLGVIRQPFSLKCLSFVAVSTAVGNFPDRKSRVNSLPVPAVIKNSLLFQVHGKFLLDQSVKASVQRVEFDNYTQQGFVGLDLMD